MIDRCGCSSASSRREPALAAQLLDQRMVAGQLAQLAVAKHVRAAVADMDDRNLVVVHEQPGERRTHAAATGVLLREIEDAAVGLGRHARELLLRAAVVRALVERLRGDPRRDLSGLGAAHAVRDGVHGRPRVVGVLVGVPLPPRIGRAASSTILNTLAHPTICVRRHFIVERSSVSPIRTGPPAAAAAGR